tara:strand:+ start:2138 stop:3679 length:1542 start_codon:yes stop_codon:yes gene_type:complete
MFSLKKIIFLSAVLAFIFFSQNILFSVELKEKEKEKSFVLGLKLFKDGFYIPAIEVFSDFLIKDQKNTKNIIARFLLAESFRKTKQFDLAIKNFQLILADKNHSAKVFYIKSYIRLGEIHELQGNELKSSINYENAFVHFKSNKSKKFSYLSSLIEKKMLRASFARYGKNDCQSSIQNIKKLELISGWKDSLSGKDYIRYLFLRGDCALRSDNFKLSKFYFSKILLSKTSLYIQEQSKFRLAISLDELNEKEKAFAIYLQIVKQKKNSNFKGFIFSLWRLSEISEELMDWKKSIRYLKLLRKSIEKKGVVKDREFSQFYGLSKIRIREIKLFLSKIQERNLVVEKEKINFARKVRNRKKRIKEIEKKYQEQTRKRDEENVRRKKAFLEALVDYKNKIRRSEEQYLRKVEKRKKKIRALRLENVEKLETYKKKVRDLERAYLRKVKNREKNVRVLKLENIKKLEFYKKKVRQLEKEYLRKVKQRKEKVLFLKKKYKERVMEREKFIRSREPLFR